MATIIITIAVRRVQMYRVSTKPALVKRSHLVFKSKLNIFKNIARIKDMSSSKLRQTNCDASRSKLLPIKNLKICFSVPMESQIH